jgi:hypothetical protein
MKILSCVNKELPFGVAVNALAHMTAGLASALSESGHPIEVDSLTDSTGVAYTGIPRVSTELRMSDPEKVRLVHARAQKMGLVVVDFVRTMTGDTYVEQLEKTKNATEADLYYYGVIVAGDDHQLDQLKDY